MLQQPQHHSQPPTTVHSAHTLREQLAPHKHRLCMPLLARCTQTHMQRERTFEGEQGTWTCETVTVLRACRKVRPVPARAAAAEPALGPPSLPSVFPCPVLPLLCEEHELNREGLGGKAIASSCFALSVKLMSTSFSPSSSGVGSRCSSTIPPGGPRIKLDTWSTVLVFVK